MDPFAKELSLLVSDIVPVARQIVELMMPPKRGLSFIYIRK